MYAAPIEALIRAFESLPSVGRRTAERYVFALLKSGKKDAAELANALRHMLTDVQSCTVCWDFTDAAVCSVCTDTKRSKETLCVVAEPQDKQVIERTGAYAGQYHVLRGRLSGDNLGALAFLKVESLLARAREAGVKEIILAFSPDMPGESTMLFLERQLNDAAPHVRVSRLARGLPVGSDMQYADDITLESALKFRQ